MAIDEFGTLLSSGALMLDVEYGNVHGFFSAHRDHGHFDVGGEEVTRSMTGHLPQATLRFDDHVMTRTEVLQRDLIVHADQTADTYDVVSRFVVRDRTHRPAWIHGQVVSHRASSVYHQFPAGKVVVPVGDIHWLSLQVAAEGDIPSNMDHVVYVRDESIDASGSCWIVHQRLIANASQQSLHLRGCHPMYNQAFPAWFDAAVPAALKRPFYRLRETRCPRSPVMAVAHARWLPGAQVRLSATLRLSHGAQPF